MIEIKIGIRNNSKNKEKKLNELFSELQRKYLEISRRFSSLNFSIPFEDLLNKLDQIDKTYFIENKGTALTCYHNKFILLNDTFFTKTTEDQTFIFIHELGHILYHQPCSQNVIFCDEYNEYLADKFLSEIDMNLLFKRICIFCKDCNLNNIENNIESYKTTLHICDNQDEKQRTENNNNFDRIFEIIFKLYSFLYLIDKDSIETEKINEQINMIRNKLELHFEKVQIGRIFDNLKNVSLNPDNILNIYEEIEKEIDLLNQ
ncbi:MAG: hypothetical protein KAT43_01240 [Nanoarchaeota archaeon]|nr:hypothetical protein [Nanoarchaeota archaeon]